MSVKGNKFWKARSKHGRDKIFSTPMAMWDAALEYFEWVSENPLEKPIVYQGEISDRPEPLMRPMTIKGLCIFWGVNGDYLTDFMDNLDKESEEGRDFSRIIKNIREIIYTQKFEGASAGLLNPNIIARDLGLANKSEITGADGGPVKLKTLNDFYSSDTDAGGDTDGQS